MELNNDPEVFDAVEGRKVLGLREAEKENPRKTFNEKIRWMIG